MKSLLDLFISLGNENEIGFTNELPIENETSRRNEAYITVKMNNTSHRNEQIHHEQMNGQN